MNNNISIAADILKEIRDGNRKLNYIKNSHKYNPKTSGIVDAEHRFYSESSDWMLISPENIKILCGVTADNDMDVAYFQDGSVAIYNPTWNSDYSNIKGTVIVAAKYRNATKYFMDYGDIIDYEI